MPYYPDEIIDQVREANDIVDVISQYVNLKRKGSSYFGLCPFHGEKTPSFSVSPSKQIYYCFGCHEGGNVIRFLQNYENLTFSEALQQLADRARITLPAVHQSAEAKRAADRRTKILEIQKAAATFYYMALRDERGRRAYEYFSNRGLTDETMKKFALGYADQYSDTLYKYLRAQGYDDDILKDSGLITYSEKKGAMDKFWNRAMFPIMDANNHVIAFGGRVMGDGEPKYLNSPETKIFDKSRTLYGLWLAKHTKRGRFILCEGYMDVIALHQAGFDNAVATLGTALTEGHANLLKRYVSELYLCYDSDGAGVKAALRAIPILREAGVECKVINMQPHKDPDEFIKALGAEEFEKRIEEARNGFLFTIDVLERDYDLKDPSQKTAFQRAIADKLLQFSEKMERDNYLDAIIAKYHYPKDGIEEMIRHQAAKGQRGIVRRSGYDEMALRNDPQNGANDGDPAGGMRPPKARPNRPPEPDGYETSMMLLLSLITDDVSIFPKISEFITPDDFLEGTVRKVAEEIFAMAANGEPIRPDSIIGKLTESEEQAKAARIFSTTIEDAEDSAVRQKLLQETVRRVKEARFSRDRDEMDMNAPGAMDIIRSQREELERIKKTSFI